MIWTIAWETEERKGRAQERPTETTENKPG